MKIGDNQVILDKAIIALNGLKEFRTSPMAGRITELVADIEMADEIDWKQEPVKKAAFLLSINPAVVAQTLQQIKESKLITIREAKLGNTKTIIELILAELSKSTKLLTDPKNQRLITDYIYGIEYNSKDDVPKDQNCIESIAYLLGMAKEKVHAVVSDIMSTSNPVQEAVNESETLSIRDMETHYYDNEDDIKSNMSTYGFKKSDIKKINNYMDFANLLGVDSRSVKDVDLREYTQALVSLMEAVHKIKRRWTDLHPAVHINPDARLRNKIISYVGSKPLSRVTTEEYREFCNSLKEDEEIGKSPSQSWLSKNKRLIETVKVGNTDYLKLTKVGKRVYKHIEEKKALNEGYEYELVDANGKNISTLGDIPKNLFLNGKKYTGEAAFINGYNGHTTTDDDATLCAIINKSCWDDNKKPNYLTDENGYRVESVGRRGQTVAIDEAKEDFAIGDKVTVMGAIFDKDAKVWKDATGEVVDNKDVRDRLRVKFEDGAEGDYFSTQVTKINESAPGQNEIRILKEIMKKLGVSTTDIQTGSENGEAEYAIGGFTVGDGFYIEVTSQGDDVYINIASDASGDDEMYDYPLSNDDIKTIKETFKINENLSESTKQTGDAWMSLKKGDVITIAEGPHDPITAKFRLDADPHPAGGEIELVVTCLEYDGPDDQDCLKKGESGTIYPMLDAEFIKESLNEDDKPSTVKVGTEELTWDSNLITLYSEMSKEKEKYTDAMKYMDSVGSSWDKINRITLANMILVAQGKMKSLKEATASIGAIHKSGFKIPNLAAGDTVQGPDGQLLVTSVGSDRFFAKNKDGRENEYTSLEGFTPVKVKSMNESMEMFDDAELTKAGFDVKSLSNEQKNLIVQPIEAPENYHQDGEITAQQAKVLWLQKMKKSGMSTTDVANALKYVFGGRSANESADADAKSLFIDAEQQYRNSMGASIAADHSDNDEYIGRKHAEQKEAETKLTEYSNKLKAIGYDLDAARRDMWASRFDINAIDKYKIKTNEEELIDPKRKQRDRVGGIAFHPPVFNDSSAPPDVQPVSMPAGTSESATTWSTAKWPDDGGKFADSECWMTKIQTVDGEKVVHLLVRQGKNKFIYHFDGVTPLINPNIGIDTVDQAKTYVEKNVKDFYSNSGEYEGYVGESKIMGGEKIYDEVIPGGLSSGKTLQDVADHHGLDLETVTLALEHGTTVEMEHTSDENAAREIAMDHLWEDPRYYDKLATIE